MLKNNTWRGQTQTINSIVNKGCHSRTSLSGIYNACCCQAKKNALLNRCVEDPRYQPSGMTAHWITTHGFTLIELLVVVLIIGILAAVALPQYQKTVLKSRFASMIPVVDALAQAERFYYQEHGTYTTNLSLLDITPPTSSAFSINAWFNSAQTQGVIIGLYKEKIQYLRNITGNATQECRAHKDNTLAIAVCSGYGEYVDTYGEFKAYRM